MCPKLFVSFARRNFAFARNYFNLYFCLGRPRRQSRHTKNTVGLRGQNCVRSFLYLLPRRNCAFARSHVNLYFCLGCHRRQSRHKKVAVGPRVRIVSEAFCIFCQQELCFCQKLFQLVLLSGLSETAE